MLLLISVDWLHFIQKNIKKYGLSFQSASIKVNEPEIYNYLIESPGNVFLQVCICPDFPPASKTHPVVLCFPLSDTVQGCPEFLFALCLRCCYTADPHAAFSHSMSEENIWESCKHSSVFSSFHRLLVLLSNTLFFFSSDNMRFCLPEASTHLGSERDRDVRFTKMNKSVAPLLDNDAVYAQIISLALPS